MGVREQKESTVLVSADRDDPLEQHSRQGSLKTSTKMSSSTAVPPPLLVASPPSPSNGVNICPAGSSSSCSPASSSSNEDSPLLCPPSHPSALASDTKLSPTLKHGCSKEELALLARLEQQNRCTAQVQRGSFCGDMFSFPRNPNLLCPNVPTPKLQRLLEADAKSLNSLTSGHSRKSSSTSLVSVGSGASQQSATGEEDGEDVWQVWGTVVSEWDMYFKKKTAFVKDLVRRGIPHHFRSIVWQLLCSAQTCPARDLYTDYLKSTSPCEKVILRDIARTYPEHDFFREKDGPGQESLFNVMKAYSLHDREVGYCQGSAFIVGLLLLQMPEEDAFSVMVRLMEDYRLREMYKPSMAELGLCMYQLECIVQEQIPEIYMHFQAQSFHTSMYASSWFLTLFTSSLPLPLACRVMDLFLSEGMEMIFRIGIAILQYCKEDLLQHDMEGMLRYFQKEMPAKCDADPDYLITLAMQVKYNSKKMKKLEKDYTSYKAKEQEDLIELRRLRTENKLLKQRIEHLEVESSSLADRLVQGQVKRIQEAEKLASMKHRELLTQQELEGAYQEIKELHEANSQHSSLDNQTEKIIKSMQQDLVVAKLREAEALDKMQDLQQRTQDLETVNKCLKESYPESTTFHVQEELVAVKAREVAAQQRIKELLQKVTELETQVDMVKEKAMANHLLGSSNSVNDAVENENDLSAKVATLENKIRQMELTKFEMELKHENTVADLKKQINYFENKNDELSRINQVKIASDNEDLKILCRRVTELQVKLAEERDLNKKLSAALESRDSDANHNMENNFTHISAFLETLRQTRNNISAEEGNFEQIYKLRLSTRDYAPSGKIELIKNKINL